MDYKVLTLALLFSAACVHSGGVSSKMIGGTEITTETRKDYNYIVVVTSDKSKVCTGVVLGAKYILVPAHCVEGSAAATVKEVIESAVEAKSSKITTHNGYNKETLENDIAIIQLEKSLSLNNNINKIQVATETPKEMTSCKVSGYGKMESGPETPAGTKASYLDVVIKAADTCSANAGQICAGVSENDGTTKTLCEGDAGAPLVCDGKLVAIAVKDDDCATKKADVFIELKDLKKWINSQINSAVSVTINPLTLLSTLLIIFKMRS